jgi:hypothetical protein
MAYKKLGPWPKGMNNRLAKHDMLVLEDDGATRMVRNAVNVDFSSSGKPRRRKGSTPIYAGLNTSGGFSCPAGCFFVEDGTLKQLNDDDTATILCALLGSNITYHYVNGALYLSDGLVSKKIVNGVVSKWGMDVPREVVLHGVTGEYSAGVYLGAVSFVDVAGVESGASRVATVSLDAGSGVVFSNLPTTTDPQAASLRLYLSTPNGAELYHIADIPIGTAEYVISAGRYDDGNVLDLAHIQPPSPGEIIRSYKGRMYVAADSHVFYSDPFEPDHFRADGTLQFPVSVRIMEPVDNGIFFATDKETFFYSGIPDDGFQVTKVLPYGAISGTGFTLPDREGVLWQSQRGLIMGANDGSVNNLQEKNVATESGTSGALLVRGQDGAKQAIAVINNPKASSLAASSFIEAEIIRRSS